MIPNRRGRDFSTSSGATAEMTIITWRDRCIFRRSCSMKLLTAEAPVVTETHERALLLPVFLQGYESLDVGCDSGIGLRGRRFERITGDRLRVRENVLTENFSNGVGGDFRWIEGGGHVEVVISSLSRNLVWRIPFERSLDTARDDDFSGGNGRGFLLVPLLARLLELFVQDRCGSREERSQDHPRIVVDVSPSPVKNVRRILPREDKSRQPLNGQRCLFLTAG